MSERKVIPIAEAAERRRQKRVSDSLSDLAESTEALAGEPDAQGYLSHPDVCWELLRASEGLGDPDASLAMLDRAVAVLPDDALLLDIQKNWREHRERRLAGPVK